MLNVIVNMKNRLEGVMILQLLLLMGWCMPLLSSHKHTSQEWTWVYHKNFAENIREGNAEKKNVWFSRDNVPPFTQLIVSWNVFRPVQGHFSFYAQVRDATTKKWGRWHHMVDWGKDVQRSYVSKSDGFSSYVHVRLEIDNKKHADAFRVKIEQQNRASLALVHNISVAISDFNQFKQEPANTIDNSLQSVHISHIPLIAQFALDHEDNGRICSPVSCSMVLHYMTGKYKDPLNFAAGAFDAGLGAYGSWGCNMAHAFENSDGKCIFFARRMNTFCDIHQQLIKGLPVVVSIRGDLPGALKSFPNGHLIVVVGWDSDTRELLCHDPAAEHHNEVLKRYPIEHFLRVWECSHRLTYVVEPIK
jgi:hypothetical protein